MKTRTFLIAAFCLLAACAKEEGGTDGPGIQPGDEPGGEPQQEASISFTADIPAFVKGESRATVDNNWSELPDPTVAVEIDGVVKAYTVDVNGRLTSEDPFLWGDKEEVTVNAWYPYTEEGKTPDENLTVMADQSKLENYVGSDWLEAVSATVTPAYSVLSFSHRVAKLVCSLTVENGTAEGAIVRLLNLKQVQEGTSVTATSDWKALMVPQTIPAGQDFVEVTVPSLGNLSFVSAPVTDFVFERGKVYYLNINVSEDGTTNINISSSVAWGNSETVPVPGTSTDVNPSPGQPGWGEGDEETGMSGESSEVTPSPGNPGWGAGGEETGMSGESSEVTPSPGNPGWGAGGEDTDISGESSGVAPSPEAPNWGNGNNTDIPGTSTGVTPSPVTPPSWENGDKTDISGSSPGVTPSPVTPPSWGDGGSETLVVNEQNTSSGQ